MKKILLILIFTSSLSALAKQTVCRDITEVKTTVQDIRISYADGTGEIMLRSSAKKVLKAFKKAGYENLNNAKRLCFKGPCLKYDSNGCIYVQKNKIWAE